MTTHLRLDGGRLVRSIDWHELDGIIETSHREVSQIDIGASSIPFNYRSYITHFPGDHLFFQVSYPNTWNTSLWYWNAKLENLPVYLADVTQKNDYNFNFDAYSVRSSVDGSWIIQAGLISLDSGKPLWRLTINSDVQWPFGISVNSGSNWVETLWAGKVHPIADSIGWYFFEHSGWVKPYLQNDQSVWIYHHHKEWLWTRPYIFPRVWHPQANEWQLFYD